MLGKYISKTLTGNRYVIADIHGCYKTFRTLVEDQIQLTPADQLFLLGDYINRGPKNKEVIDYIISLPRKGYSVYPLRGNHEEMRITNRLQDLLPVYHDFFNSLLHYYEIPGFYLVHASLNFHAANPLEDSYAMLWERTTTPDMEFLNGKRVVHGHTIHSLAKIKEAVEERRTVIPLDNGCYRALNSSNTAFGHLCGLNLDTFELFIQPNLDH